jgi:hypothetical protein
LLIKKAVCAIVKKTVNLSCKYNIEINRNRRSSLQLMDKRAFALIKQKLTYYAIKLTMHKLFAAKRLANDVIKGLVLNFKLKTKCTKEC